MSVVVEIKFHSLILHTCHYSHN